MTEAQVIKLSGQAWAVNGRGERRALKEGDRVQADEMIITDVGASIELDLGDAGLITLQGEHSSPLLEELLSTPEHQPLPSLDTPQDIPAAVSGSSGALKGEGGKFVQLVRIAEILEADGYHPVRVKRIEELLKPLGMSYPDRSRAPGTAQSPPLSALRCLPATTSSTPPKPSRTLPSAAVWAATSSPAIP